MVGCDLLRAVLLATMAIPGMPIWALGLLLVAVQLAAAPFTAARAAVLPIILPGDRYVVGNGLMNTTFQTGLLCGYAAGAPLIAVIGTGWALLLDALTFGISAVLIAVGLQAHRPAKDAGSGRARTTLGSLRAGLRLVSRDRRLRSLLGIACLVGFYVVPTGLAVPYAALLVADPVGSALGAVLITRLVPPELRLRLLGPLAVATSLVLLPTAFAPGLWLTVLLWALCGLFSAHDTVTAATFMQAVPDEARGQAYGLASSALRAAQGLGVALAGLVAEFVTPGVTVAAFAAGGVLAGVLAAIGWHGARVSGEG